MGCGGGRERGEINFTFSPLFPIYKFHFSLNLFVKVPPNSRDIPLIG